QHVSDAESTAVRSDVQDLRTTVAGLEDQATAQEEKDQLAADAKSRVERSIARKRTVELQKNWQVADWKVTCVVATSNTLNCVGKGFLDGDESTESYDA